MKINNSVDCSKCQYAMYDYEYEVGVEKVFIGCRLERRIADYRDTETMCPIKKMEDTNNE